MAKAIAAAVRKSAPTRDVPTRASRVKTVFRTDNVKLERLSSTVTVYAEEQLIEIPCFIISNSKDGIVVRQKARAGSSKQIVKTYPRSRLITQTVETGNGIIHVIDRAPVLILKDQSVSYEGTFLLSSDNKSGEVTRIDTVNPKVSVDVTVEDENAAAKAAGKAAPTKKPKLQAVPTSRKRNTGDFDE